MFLKLNKIQDSYLIMNEMCDNSMKKVKFKMIISGEECGIDMPVSR